MHLPCRVDKLLRACTDQSLSDLRVACAAGRVRIFPSVFDGSPNADTAAGHVLPSDLVFEDDVVELDGHRVSRRTAFDYLALHKPVGVTTTVRDPDGHEDLSAWLEQMPRGVFPLGRLDRDTSGLLLCSNDGDFAHALLHPVHHVEKSYRLSIGGCLDDTDPRLSAIVQGVVVQGHPTPLRAASVQIVERSELGTKLVVRLREGKHRQLRKMCHALRLRLTGLHRFAIGSVELDGLAVGAFRNLRAEEIAELWSLAGGHELVWQRQFAALERQARAARAAQCPLTRLEHWLSGNANDRAAAQY